MTPAAYARRMALCNPRTPAAIKNRDPAIRQGLMRCAPGGAVRLRGRGPGAVPPGPGRCPAGAPADGRTAGAPTTPGWCPRIVGNTPRQLWGHHRTRPVPWSFGTGEREYRTRAYRN